jgi:hypothetical protein
LRRGAVEIGHQGTQSEAGFRPRQAGDRKHPPDGWEDRRRARTRGRTDVRCHEDGRQAVQGRAG